ncbi:glycosyltransferase family 2 protein [Marinomonas sp.]|uniref:glycosyltransferase family 2 protein n=1 Tax=Marinomonas sp. TaxID=1904862 RepID=UPI003BAB3581
MYDVSIITVNFNSSDDTLNMIDSISKKTSLNYEVIVVDNNSSPAEYKKLHILQGVRHVKVVRSQINLGFSGGNMLGVKACSSESSYLFFLNNDTLLLDNTVDILFKNCEDDASIGLISPQQYDENNKIVSSFKYFPNALESFLGRGFVNLISKKKIYSNKKTYNSIIEVGVVSGASMFFRRECFNKTKGFDTNFFLYCEEEDISKKVWSTEFKVCFNSMAKIVHFCGKSTERSFEIERESIISYYRLINKHLGFFNKSFLKLYMLIKYFKRRKRSKNNKNLFRFLLTPNKDKYSLKHSQKASIE